MKEYEYKTVSLAYHLGLFKDREPDLENVLNHKVEEGWRLREILVPGKDFAQAQRFLVILERKTTSS